LVSRILFKTSKHAALYYSDFKWSYPIETIFDIASSNLSKSRSISCKSSFLVLRRWLKKVGTWYAYPERVTLLMFKKRSVTVIFNSEREIKGRFLRINTPFDGTVKSPKLISFD
jgi:uncharacterized membrane protein